MMNIFLFPLIFILLMPYPGFIGSSALRMVDILTLLIPLLFVLVIAVSKKRIPTHVIYFIFYLLLAVQIFAIFTSTTSISFISDILELYKLILCFTCFVYGLIVSPYVNQEKVRYAIWFVTFCIAIVCIFQFIFGPSIFYYMFSGRGVDAINTQFTSRIIGTLGNPNFVAIYFSSVFFFFFNDYLKHKEKINLIFSVSCFLLLLLTQSRSTLIYFIIVFYICFILIMFCNWLNYKEKFKFIFIVSSISIICVFMFTLLLNSGYLRYVATGFEFVVKNGLSEQSSFSGRVLMWNFYMDLIKEKPFFGYGPSKDYFMFSVADNNYIFILFKYGLFGLICYIFIFIYLIKRLLGSFLKANDNFEALPLFLGVMIFMCSMTSEMIDSMRITPFFFMLCGLTIGLKRYEK
ncbi:O-antigen ligase family protein [Vibrio diabolicus]|uniref:O-antigen ligase family protein n=1 Tax=Vibrio diabolicus TaxID=50719 RepID=UPI00375262C0